MYLLVYLAIPLRSQMCKCTLLGIKGGHVWVGSPGSRLRRSWEDKGFRHTEVCEGTIKKQGWTRETSNSDVDLAKSLPAHQELFMECPLEESTGVRNREAFCTNEYLILLSSPTQSSFLLH